MVFCQKADEVLPRGSANCHVGQNPPHRYHFFILCTKGKFLPYIKSTPIPRNTQERILYFFEKNRIFMDGLPFFIKRQVFSRKTIRKATPYSLTCSASQFHTILPLKPASRFSGSMAQNRFSPLYTKKTKQPPKRLL